ncbi:hypothetical protein MLD59_23720 [Verrucomicrobiaceae bacterium E54]|nr:hypothetical protein [Verrucomicrobiaceae bacterium E54]
MKSENLDADPPLSNKGAGGGRMRRLVRLVKWTAWNAGIASLAWLGVVHSNAGAGRLLAFICWTFAVLILLAACNKEVAAKAREKGRSIPAWMSHGFGMCLIGFLIWNGWIATAIALLIWEIAEAALFHQPRPYGCDWSQPRAFGVV